MRRQEVRQSTCCGFRPVAFSTILTPQEALAILTQPEKKEEILAQTRGATVIARLAAEQPKQRYHGPGAVMLQKLCDEVSSSPSADVVDAAMTGLKKLPWVRLSAEQVQVSAAALYLGLLQYFFSDLPAALAIINSDEAKAVLTKVPV